MPQITEGSHLRHAWKIFTILLLAGCTATGGTSEPEGSAGDDAPVETTAPSQTATTSEFADLNSVEEVRRFAALIRQGGYPTFVDQASDAELIDQMKAFCATADAGGVRDAAAEVMKPAADGPASDFSAVYDALMTTRMWQVGTTEYCPQHSEVVAESVQAVLDEVRSQLP